MAQEWTAVVRNADGEHDITENLQRMFDMVVGSMDWGSGFLDQEDVEALYRVASMCGFESGFYPIDNGGVILLDEEDQPLSTTSVVGSASYLDRNGYAERSLSANGEVLELRNVVTNAAGTLAKVAYFAHWKTNEAHLYSLDTPIGVEAGATVKLKIGAAVDATNDSAVT